MKADGKLSLSNDTGLYLNTSVTGNDVLTAAGTFVAPSKATKAEAGIITLEKPMTVGDESIQTFTVNKDTVFIAIDDEDVTVVDLGYITVDSDFINVIPDKDNNNLAAYVFILE